MAPRWTPSHILTNIDNSSCSITCVGYAPSQGRRCHNPIAAANRQDAAKLLKQMSKLDLSSSRIDGLLEQLAPRVLCKRYHQNQFSSMVSQWQDDLEDLQEEEAPRRAEDARRAREATRRAEDARRAREAARRAEDARRARETAQRAEDARRAREAAQRAEEERRAQDAAWEAAENTRREQEAAQRAEEERHAQDAAWEAAENTRREQEAAQRAEDERHAQDATREVAENTGREREAAQQTENARREEQATSEARMTRSGVETSPQATPPAPITQTEQLTSDLASMVARVEALEQECQELRRLTLTQHFVRSQAESQETGEDTSSELDQGSSDEYVTTPTSPLSSDDGSEGEEFEDRADRIIEGDCSICLESLGSESDLTSCRAQCGQHFHLSCIGIWLATDEHTQTCPYW